MLRYSTRIDGNTCIEFQPPTSESVVRKTIAKICLCVDVSGSMSQEAQVINDDGDEISHGWNILDVTKHASNILVHCLDSEDMVTCVTFSNEAHVISNWKNASQLNKEIIQTELMNMKTQASTSYKSGLFCAMQQIKEDALRNFLFNSVYFLIFFTDGLPSVEDRPSQGYSMFLENLKRQVYTEVGFFFTIHVTVIGLGNKLDSDILAEMSPHGFLYISNPGMIGSCICNLIAHCKSIANIDGHPMICPEIRIYPAHALIDSLAYKISYTTKEYTSFNVGPILFDIPRHFIVKTKHLKQVKLVSSGSEISALQNIWKSAFDEEIYRSQIVQALEVFHDRNGLSTIISLIEKLPSNSLLRATMNTEMMPGLTQYYNSWGKHFRRTLYPMLRDQRRHSFRDQCVSNYNKDIHGTENTMFEKLTNKAEITFANTKPPKPSLSTSNNNVTRNTNVVRNLF